MSTKRKQKNNKIKRQKDTFFENWVDTPKVLTLVTLDLDTYIHTYKKNM